MRRVTYVDKDGCKYERMIPDSAPDSHAKMGIPIGPPCLSSLGLDKQVEIRLHNQLHSRGILTQRDAESRLNEVAAAIMAALRLDASRVLELYQAKPLVQDVPD